MNSLKTLCLMQLKDKVDFSAFKKIKTAIFKIVFEMVKFLFVTIAIYFGMYILSYLRLVSLLPGIPQNFYVVLFSFVLMLSIIVCTFGLVKTLYFARDNFFLLTMPTSRTQVFLSKAIVFTVYEFLKNIYFVSPMLIAIGFINRMNILFFLWIPFATLLFTLVSVSVGALLSIPILYVENFLKSYKPIEYSFVIVCVAGVTFILVALIGAIPEDFDLVGSWGTTFWEIQAFLNNINEIFSPFCAVAIALIGTRYGISNVFMGKTQLIYLGIIGVLLIGIWILTFLIVRPIYFHMASSPFEYKREKSKKLYKNKKLSSFQSSVKKDILLTYRTPEKFYMLMAITIGMPLAIFLLNKIYSAMDTRLAGTNMSIAFNILMILLISLSSNSNLSNIISEEGGASYLIKTHPNSYIKMIMSKLMLNIVCLATSMLATVIIFASYMGIGIIYTILIYMSIVFFYIGHMFFSVECDITNPETEIFQQGNETLGRKNNLKSTLMGFVLSIVVGIIVYFLISENIYVVWYKVFGIATIYISYRTYLFVSKVKVYYKERV